MTRLQKAQKEVSAIKARVASALDAKMAKPEDWTPENQAALDADNKALDAAIVTRDTAKRLDDEERNTPATSAASGDGSLRIVGGGTPNSDRDPAKGFKTPSEYLKAVRAAARGDMDERLTPLAVADDKGAGAFLLPKAMAPLRAAVGSDEHNASQDGYGGFAVRDTLLGGLLQVGADADPTSTQSVPMETPSVKILARVDKDHSSSVSGGLTVARRAEMASFASSRTQIERITLNASMLAGLAYETEELMQDSMLSFAALIAAGFRTEFAAAKLNEKLRGTGGDQYVGVLDSSNGCKVSVSKESGQAADTINATNVIKMRARCWGYGSAIWIANPDCYPQLSQLAIAVGTGGQLVYQTSLTGDRPDTLLGRPIFYNEFANTVGDEGDLILGNWSQYLEGVYQPLQSASSIHVRFETHEQTFKFWERNAGAPWWRSALTPKRGSNTLSPFVTLAARA